MKQYIKAIKQPLIFTVVNFLVVNFVLNTLLPEGIVEFVFNIARIAIIFWAGYLAWTVTYNLWKAALSGPILLFIDHVMFKGGYFVILQFYDSKLLEDQGLLAFGGVLISFIMFTPVAIICAIFGGWLSKRKFTHQRKIT